MKLNKYISFQLYIAQSSHQEMLQKSWSNKGLSKRLKNSLKKKGTVNALDSDHNAIKSEIRKFKQTYQIAWKSKTK